MADMTLQSHAERLRKAAEEIRAEGHLGWGNTCESAADAIDAHLAGMGEPAVRRLISPKGEAYGKWESASINIPLPVDMASDGWKYQVAFTAPPASGDRGAVRDVIDALEDDGDELGCAAMLRVSLPESRS